MITYAVPTTSAAGPDRSRCGLTTSTLEANTPASGTGLWSIVSGAGGTLVTPTSPTSVFNGTNGSTYTLRWTISNGTCTSSDDVTISFPLLPVVPQPFFSSSPTVCQGQTGVAYAVPLDPSVTYNWNYSGTGATISGTTNSITVDFDAIAINGTLSVTATNGCGISAARSIAITVNTVPTILTTTPGSTCGTGTVTLGATASAGTINWYAAATGGASLGTGTSFTTPSISSTTIYYVDATDWVVQQQQEQLSLQLLIPSRLSPW